MRRNKFAANVVGFDDNNKTKILPVIKYQCIHGLLCLLAISITFVMYHSIVIHTLFCCAIMGVSAYNGGI